MKAQRLKFKILKSRLLTEQAHQAEAEWEATRSSILFENTEEEIEDARENRARARGEAEAEANYRKDSRRPSRVLWPDVFFNPEEKKWVCMHSGVRAYGDTPEIACDNFDHLWMYGK